MEDFEEGGAERDAGGGEEDEAAPHHTGSERGAPEHSAATEDGEQPSELHAPSSRGASGRRVATGDRAVSWRGGTGDGAGSQGTRPATTYSISPELFALPTPTPAVMEWRQQVDHALSVLHTRLDSLEAPHLDPLEPPHHRHTTAQSEEGVSGGGEAESDAHTRPPTSGLPRAGNSANRKNAKLVKEIKDEEDAFGKRVTAGAMQAGKDASAKAMLRIDALVDTVKSLTTQSDGVQSALREELAESRRKEERMLSALEESVVAQKELRADVLALQKQAKTHEKQRSDLEEALFFLQDEIARATAKPTTAPKSAAAKGKPPAPAGKAAANKSPAKGANASPVKARK